MQIWETGAPGWAEVGLPDFPSRVLVKVAERDGRWVIAKLIVSSEEVTAATLKSLPIARIESMLNQPGIGRGVATQTIYESKIGKWMRSYVDEFGKVDAGLDAFLASEPQGYAPGPEPAEREPLARPDGSDPERFYRQVADAYNDVVRFTTAPAKVLAAEADVPVVTVHRWIHEARRRGFLPPARKGRAG